ncbi:MAG: hypothetical protein M0Q91_12900 [Methanoregula sp.]|nr:hypothetical protein [Methanoregula sp.]
MDTKMRGLTWWLVLTAAISGNTYLFIINIARIWHSFFISLITGILFIGIWLLLEVYLADRLLSSPRNGGGIVMPKASEGAVSEDSRKED